MAPAVLSIKLQVQDPLTAAELGVHNEPYEINRLLVQTSESATEAVFKTELQQISYGLVDNTRVALIVFQSQFLFTSRNRIKQATIRLCLRDSITSNVPQNAPRILKIAPSLHQGVPAMETRVSTSVLRIPVSSTGISHQHVSLSERSLTRHARIQGMITSHHPRKHANVQNRAVWITEENEVNKTGIPPFFRGAILVGYEHERPFQMTLEVDVVQGFSDSMLQFLRKSMEGEDDPVYFRPGEAYPPGATGLNLRDIDLEELVIQPAPTVILA